MENNKEYVIEISDMSKPVYLSLGLGAVLFIIYFMVIDRISLSSTTLQGYPTLIYLLIFIGSIIVSAIIHEALHAITFLLLTKSSPSKIKFGFYKGNPYCHCSNKIKVKHYRIVLLTPLIILGVMLYILGLYTKESVLILIGVFNIVSAVGDVCVYKLLKKLSSEEYVQDHPSKIGFYLCK